MQRCITLQGVVGMNREENINTTWRRDPVSLGCSVLTPVIKLICRTMGTEELAHLTDPQQVTSDVLMLLELWDNSFKKGTFDERTTTGRDTSQHL